MNIIRLRGAIKAFIIPLIAGITFFGVGVEGDQARGIIPEQVDFHTLIETDNKNMLRALEWEKDMVAVQAEVPPVMELEATSYSLHGTTFTGTKTGPGTIAVDPNVIPLGTKLYIEGYGEGVATDTGRLIKGNIIDVWYPSNKESLEWGRKKVKVWIMK